MTVNDKYNHINLDYLELMADGDTSMKKIMLDMLLDELPAELEKMKTLLVQPPAHDSCGRHSRRPPLRSRSRRS